MSSIPKVIHYCWFGGKPLPKLARKCIRSWKKYLPDYEIQEWNESNFDVNIIPYTAQAYEAKKYAFVSDYARFWILYKYGGLYFDTDVEVIRNMDRIIEAGSFMGCETTCEEAQARGGGLSVAPGLGLGAPAGSELYKEILD
ncbi:MAG: glycosyl transferase, partial [Paramuribaculum sp.]|nr:glycosyl transferase [Paramuribaculum sp.]